MKSYTEEGIQDLLNMFLSV